MLKFAMHASKNVNFIIFLKKMRRKGINNYAGWCDHTGHNYAGWCDHTGHNYAG